MAKVRARLRVSQVAFARLLNVSLRTVQAWETNARTPSDAALKLLHIARRHPGVLLESHERNNAANTIPARGARSGQAGRRNVPRQLSVPPALR